MKIFKEVDCIEKYYTKFCENNYTFGKCILERDSELWVRKGFLWIVRIYWRLGYYWYELARWFYKRGILKLEDGIRCPKSWPINVIKYYVEESFTKRR